MTRFLFSYFISDIYPKELIISNASESTSIASYLDLLFTTDENNNITTKSQVQVKIYNSFGRILKIPNTDVLSFFLTSSLIFTPKSSPFLTLQNLLELLPISTTNENNNIATKLYNKRDVFSFYIVNLPFMSSNIRSAPAYGVYASQVICYVRCCSNCSDFLSRQRALVTRLLSQGCKVDRLSNMFRKFYGRHTDLVGQYKRNACQMFADSTCSNDLLAFLQICQG